MFSFRVDLSSEGWQMILADLPPLKVYPHPLQTYHQTRKNGSIEDTLFQNREHFATNVLFV